MIDTDDELVSPAGDVAAPVSVPVPGAATPDERRAIALVDNGKPNAQLFLNSVEAALQRAGETRIVRVRKPRSAEACPDLDALARDCDRAIGAVAD